MTIAVTLENFLDQQKVSYEIINHDRTYSCMEAARTCHLSADCIAKSVLLDDGKHYFIAVVPASSQVSINNLNYLSMRRMSLASENDAKKLFNDCELGAYPPIGKAYGLETFVDDTLLQQQEIYFEAGDHTEIIHMSGEQFKRLMGDVPHGNISRFRSQSYFGQQRSH